MGDRRHGTSVSIGNGHDKSLFSSRPAMFRHTTIKSPAATCNDPYTYHRRIRRRAIAHDCRYCYFHYSARSYRLQPNIGQGRENEFEVGGRICAFTQCKKCQNFVLLLIPKQYHLKCKNNINIVLYLGFADIILGAFNTIEIFIQDTGLVEYRL